MSQNTTSPVPESKKTTKKASKKTEPVAESVVVVAPPAPPPALKLEEAFYTGNFSPLKTETIAASGPEGIYRVLRETWQYKNKGGEVCTSTKIAVRSTFRRRDNRLYLAEPMANVKLDQWESFCRLITSIK